MFLNSCITLFTASYMHRQLLLTHASQWLHSTQGTMCNLQNAVYYVVKLYFLRNISFLAGVIWRFVAPLACWTFFLNNKMQNANTMVKKEVNKPFKCLAMNYRLLYEQNQWTDILVWAIFSVYVSTIFCVVSPQISKRKCITAF